MRINTLRICMQICMLTIMTTHPLMPQTLPGRYTTRLSQDKIEMLLNELSQGDHYASVRRLFFDQTYDEKMADLIFYIDERKSAEEPVIQLIQNNHRKERLFGERFVYVMAFIVTDTVRCQSVIRKKITETGKKSATSCISPDCGNQTGDADACCANPAWALKIHLTSLEQSANSGEFALLSLFNEITSAISNKLFPELNKESVCDEIDCSADVFKLGTRGQDMVFFAFAKFPVQVNTINRIRVGEMGTSPVYQATFGNYSDGRLTSSVGILTSCPDKRGCRSVKEEVNRYPAVAPFMFAHLYLKRPQIPSPRYNNSCKEFRNKLSYSLLFGTNIKKDFFNDLFLGFCIGHAVSKIGIIGGINFKEVEYRSPEEEFKIYKRELHYSAGFSYIF